jgi:uncharacterized protein (DUF302 family)
LENHVSYAHTVTIALPYEVAVQRTRELLTEQGFGVLSEINVRSTFEAKLGVESAQALGDYVILGVCNPVLAQRALTAEPDMGLLLPCNVVIRRGPDATVTVVQTIDPQTMVQLSDSSAVQEVENDADARLRSALKNLEAEAQS